MVATGTAITVMAGMAATAGVVAIFIPASAVDSTAASAEGITEASTVDIAEVPTVALVQASMVEADSQVVFIPQAAVFTVVSTADDIRAFRK